MVSRISHSSKSIYTFCLLVLVSLISFISLLPLDAKEPNPDSGIFLYMGQRILRGDTLYVDLWDNKGPLLYYINALAVYIGHNSMWGLYVVEFISLFVAVYLGYLVIKKAFCIVPAIFASVIWPLALYYSNLGGEFGDNGGNYTEEYSLPLSFAAIYLFLRSRSSNARLIYVFFIGAIFSLSFFLRPNNTGIEISITLLIFISGIYNRRFYTLVKEILAYALGSATIMSFVILCFYRLHALNDFYDAFVRYNSVYSIATMKERISSLLFGLNLISPSGLPLIVMVSWVVGIFTLISKAHKDEMQRTLISVGVIGLPIEFILSSTSGFPWTHYYLCWLPVFAILTGYFVFELIRNFSASKLKVYNRNIDLCYVWLIGFLIAMSCIALVGIHGRALSYISTSKSDHENTELEAIKNNLDHEKYLLMWGTAAYYNFATNVKSPSRFFHQLQQYVCAYSTDEIIEEFLNDIEQKKPLIVDTTPNFGNFPPVDKDEREKKWKYIDFTGRINQNCVVRPKMYELFDYIDSHYKLVDTTERYKWKIYRYAAVERGLPPRD